jgi:DNA-binding beta-propeller fold protein YncE
VNQGVSTLPRISTIVFVLVAATRAANGAGAAPAPALVLESKIALGQVRGRLDHMAVDIARQRLFVAELGNDTVGVVDIKNHVLLRSLVGLHEPQGIGYEPTTDTLYVANGGDGTVQIFRGAELSPVGEIALGSDADNVRVDGITHHVLVGYASGALAVIDPVSRQKIANIPLKAHPESFQVDLASQQIFVNVPDASQVAVVDRTTNRQTGSWSPDGLRANFPLAIDFPRHYVLVVYRHPSKLAVFDAQSGVALSTADTCNDADDIFVDAKRSQVYISCGEGFIDVRVAHRDSYVRAVQVPTAGGARTALFVPELDRYFLAVRASAHQKASIWVFGPTP